MAATETQTPTAPELTIFSRVASIPLVNESLSTVHETLISHTLTASPYSLAQYLGKSALGYSQPIQIRLAPLLTRADGIANQGLDAVESRYPGPFKVTSDDLRQQRDSLLKERVRDPVYSAAQAIDQRFAPIVDFAANRLHGDQNSTTQTEESQYQYQRALALSSELRDQIYTYSTQQLADLEKQSVLVQHAKATALAITDRASSSYSSAQAKVHALSDTMIAQLNEIKASTSTLPQQVQTSFHDISEGVSSSIHDITEIVRSDDPVNEKAAKVRSTVQTQVQPVLDATSARLHEIFSLIAARAQEQSQELKDIAQRGSKGESNGQAS